MKKSLKLILFIILIVSSMSLVYSSNFINHDFGNFSVDVPEDVSFEEDTGYMIMALLVDELSGNIDSIKDSENDPQYTHPIWTDKNSNMSIGYYDFNEDRIDSIQTLMETEYNMAYPIDQEDNYKIYDISDCEINTFNNSYMAVKVREGFLFGDGNAMITICGNNEDELKQMAQSISFK